MTKPTGGGGDTFPKLLLENAQRWPSNPAFREKDLGIWQVWNWRETYEEVKNLSLGLKQLGCKEGEKVAIIGANRPQLYWGIVAVQAIGGVPVPLYADAIADEMSYVLQHAEVTMAIVEDQEQVDKVLSIAENLPELRHVIYEDPKGLRDYDHTDLSEFKVVQEIGRRHQQQFTISGKHWREGIANGSGSDVAVMLYTSGTTGRPKGVMLTFDNLIISARNANSFDGLDHTESTLAYLPMAWVGDHVFSVAQAYTAGYCVNCPENMETVLGDRKEISPTYFFAPPRVFEGLLTHVMVRMEDASGLKKRMFDYFLKVANRIGGRLLDGQTVTLGERVLYGLGSYFVYSPLKNQMGFSRVKVAYTAGEAIGPEIFRFYRSLGINLKQLYGQTESSVFITAQPNGEIYPDTVGTPFTGVELKITENGEVLYRSPGAFNAYFKNEEATKETKDAEGWVKTGDAGMILENGHLKIIDRAKDVGKLTSGHMVAPKYIENKLKFFPNIKEAVIFGNQQDFATAFINIDLVAVGNWAERNNIAYASYQELAAHPQVYGMIEEHIDQVNQDLARENLMAEAQIRRFLILHKELDADDGELTRTLKVRRKFVSERYEPLITALYDGSTSKHVVTTVSFEDGRSGTIEATVEIRDLQPHASGAGAAVMEAAE
ncbi:AMP-binding protein [Flexibacterium corallicola]|uniref:AMP-binding protein n=1 Tax=Flexibacterium corallicola TaxID=3037259 RepID=UPI00286F58FA|nr:AMP-binding protein [Pseudovibrio sp. M1P-2-3]